MALQKNSVCGFNVVCAKQKFLSKDMPSPLQRLDVDFEKCYENDEDWTLLPEKLREVSILLFLW